MIYRVKIVAWSSERGEFLLPGNLFGEQMRRLGLRAPKERMEGGLFWFTERGFARIGRKLRVTKELGDAIGVKLLGVRWQRMKNPKPSNVVYKDQYQVCIHM